MRKAFSLVTAIFVMVLMASVSALVFSLSSKITTNSTSQYQREQAALLAKSYTELAIMAVMDHNRTSSGQCVQRITGNINGIVQGQATSGNANRGTGYRVDTRIYYLGNGLRGICTRKLILNDNNKVPRINITENYNDYAKPDALAAIVIDVNIQYKDPNQVDSYLANGGTPSGITANVPWITFHRRTLQKI
ncbi:MAG TPA: hypothetical protein ENK39_04825 [Epsilonproteobacteria bacterium]|nr:hypothetical protein [Campylobacterota bacterium]